jgi:hypothetical protein
MATVQEILDNLGGAALIAGCVIFRPLVKARYQRWGATAEERSRSLPGDERVPNSFVTNNQVITINARAADIWPWVAQLGQERGGMYSYELLENLIGCKMHNADHIVPEWEMKVGDLMRMGPPGYPVEQIVALERGHWLLMAGANPKTSCVDPLPQPGQTTYTNGSWLLYLDERTGGITRLISRSRLAYAPRTFAFKLIWEMFTDPIAFVMTRKMLLTLKRHAESAKS